MNSLFASGLRGSNVAAVKRPPPPQKPQGLLASAKAQSRSAAAAKPRTPPPPPSGLIIRVPAREPVTFHDKPDPLLAAVRYVQKSWRGRKTRRLLTMFPSMKALKEKFVDAEALSAGAANHPMYSNAALKARQLLQHDAHVNAALTYAWRAVAWQRGRAEAVRKPQYLVMMRKLYLALKEDAEDLDPSDCHRSSAVDWERDSQGDGELDEAEFKSAWFQLCDVYTDGLDADEYASWIYGVANAITKPAGGGGGAERRHRQRRAALGRRRRRRQQRRRLVALGLARADPL